MLFIKCCLSDVVHEMLFMNVVHRIIFMKLFHSSGGIPTDAIDGDDYNQKAIHSCVFHGLWEFPSTEMDDQK